jgi:hypothetical protein
MRDIIRLSFLTKDDGFYDFYFLPAVTEMPRSAQNDGSLFIEIELHNASAFSSG